MEKVLFVMPVVWGAHLPHFRSRFELLSRHIECHVMLTGNVALDGDRFDNTVLHVQDCPKTSSAWGFVKSTVAMIRRAVSIALKEKVHYVVAYDPLTLGVVAAVVKLATGCRCIIEVNGHIKDAKDAAIGGSKVGLSKRLAHNIVGTLVLSLSDSAKVLNEDQLREWETVLRRKPCFMFHDFVPAKLFALGKTERETAGSYVLCVGFPFRRKGVDILLDAYDKIRAEFPEVRLVIVGHCEEPELSKWRSRIEAVPGAELRRPVPYDQMVEIVRGCLLLAAPSRSEAMGRVLVEAMACGKAVVGSRVGGIPNIVRHGVNGLLVEPGNADDLAEKLRELVSDHQLRHRMGDEGARMCRTVLSEERYLEAFMLMLRSLSQTPPAHKSRGLVFSGYGSLQRVR